MGLGRQKNFAHGGRVLRSGAGKYEYGRKRLSVSLIDYASISMKMREYEREYGYKFDGKSE